MKRIMLGVIIGASMTPASALAIFGSGDEIEKCNIRADRNIQSYLDASQEAGREREWSYELHDRIKILRHRIMIERSNNDPR